MKFLKKNIKWEKFNPFLIVYVSISFLYVRNIFFINPLQMVRITLVLTLFILIVRFLFGFIIKNEDRRDLILSLFVAVFLLYGHVLRVMHYFRITSWLVLLIDEHKSIFLLILFLLLFFTARKINRLKINIIAVSGFIFKTCVILLICNFLLIALYWKDSLQSKIIDLKKRGFSVLTKAEKQDNPDIYYIILDAHLRADRLKELYGYKDDILTPFLLEKGFYVATESSSNYLETRFSIMSSLSMDYLTDVKFIANKIALFNRPSEYDAIVKNLREQGYEVHLYSSDYFISLEQTFTELNLGLNRFEQLFIKMTVFYEATNLIKLDYNSLYRERILSMFEYLKKVPQNPKPTFTFIHFVSPHPPFIFDKEGNSINQDKLFSFNEGVVFPGTKEEYKKGYLGQLIFIDKKARETIDTILQKSDRKPIIIIQGDHGPASETVGKNITGQSPADFTAEQYRSNKLALEERSSILNAYYFPDGDYTKLYPSISPVNTFRFLLNQYFGGNYPLLEDKTLIKPQYLTRSNLVNKRGRCCW